MKIISLNIEERRRLDLVRPFFKQANADVICLQEVMEKDLPVMAAELNMTGVFAPMKHLRQDPATANRKGIGIMTRGNIGLTDTTYYSSFLPGPERKESDLIVASHCALLYIDTVIDDVRYSVGTTHFMWAPGGEVAPAQHEALERLLASLERYPDLVLTGDFNCPRGKAIFDILAEHYMDNIPASVTTTIDGAYHRAGDLELVVDGLFTTDHYKASEVTVETGLSDHCAVVGSVIRTAQ